MSTHVTQWRLPQWPAILQRLLGASAARRHGPEVLQLADHETRVLRDVAGATVVCEHGVAWITQQDDPKDIALRVGHRAVLERTGKTVVLALGGCRLRVERRE